MPSTFVITEACIGVKDATCVDVCPAACIHTTPEAPQYYIDPEVCIACEQCVLVCPVNAIYPDDDLPAHLQHYLEINAQFFLAKKTAAPPLSSEEAGAMIAAARRYAEEAGIEAAIAVVDDRGEQIVTWQAAHSEPEALQSALDKAYTAASLQLATHQAARGAAMSGFELPVTVDRARLVQEGGGYPVMDGGDLIGAIGVATNASPQTDLQCCLAALAALRRGGH